MVEKTWWNLKIIKNDIAQKQHGIIKCDRNVWNVLHVWKKTHTHTCTHMYWNTFEPSGRRHENACKITERKNGNTATARATVNNNTTSTTVAAAAGRACSWFCICICCKYVCLCAIADGRTFDICVEYALVLWWTCVQTRSQKFKSKHRYSAHGIQTTFIVFGIFHSFFSKCCHFLKSILFVGRTVSDLFFLVVHDSRFFILHIFVSHQNSNTLTHSQIYCAYYTYMRINLLRSGLKLNGW